MISKDLLLLFNPWWRDGSVGGDLAKPYRRKIFTDVVKGLDLRQIQLITGLRRVGKSTILYQLVDHLIGRGVQPRRIVYYSFDVAEDGILEILRSYSQLTGVDWRSERVYLLLDEIQKVDGWSSWLKIIYDSHPNLKILVSGSSSLHLEEDAQRNLAGRYIIHKVEPLSLIEFFELKTGRTVDNPDLWRDDLLAVLEEYLRKPFPEIVNWSDVPALTYIRESVLEKVLASDLSTRGLDRFRTYEILSLLFSEPGLYLNVNTLAGEVGMSKKTLYKYLGYMENSYLVRILRNYRPSVRASSRKMKRIYPYHWSLLYGLVPRIERGALLESIAASLLNAVYYWREGVREVDFVVLDGDSIAPIEVKAKDSLRRDDLRNLAFFMGRYGIRKGFLIYMGDDGVEELDGGIVRLISLLSLCISGKWVLGMKRE
ncbi:MAG: ATP-binding protein [Candidatus Korarchaeota archaeon]|nr:ATP-binding protein [Candidatus Korarchaeota archaeon]